MKAARLALRAAGLAAFLAIGFLAIGLTVAMPARAGGEGGVQQSCWAPGALAGRLDEKHAQWTREQTPLPAISLPAATPSPILGTVRRVKLPPGRKLVALTFDMCEAAMEIAGYDAEVIDYLRAQKVKATLFVGGKWMVHHNERASQLMSDPLFEIGTHSWSHANLHVVTGQAMEDEIIGGITAFDQTRRTLDARSCAVRSPDLSRIPAGPKLFRFPFGTCTPEALATVAREGQIAIQWDVVTGDPDRRISAEQIARAVLAETKPGSIIIAHANGRGAHTSEALPMFVPQLRARGFEFVTVSELMAAGTPEIASTCYERRPGDNNRYDRVARLRQPQWPAVPEPKSTASAPRAPATLPAAPAPAEKAAPPPAWGTEIERWP